MDLGSFKISILNAQKYLCHIQSGGERKEKKTFRLTMLAVIAKAHTCTKYLFK